MAINYNEHTWTYGEELTPDNFNNIEKGIKANADAINEVNNNLTWTSLTASDGVSGYAGVDISSIYSKAKEIHVIAQAKVSNSTIRFAKTFVLPVDIGSTDASFYLGSYINADYNTCCEMVVNSSKITVHSFNVNKVKIDTVTAVSMWVLYR